MQTPSQRALGVRGLLELLEAIRGEPIEAARAHLVQLLDEREGTSVQDDDLAFGLIDVPRRP